MYHPVFVDPATLKDSEIELRIFELSKKYNIVMSLGKVDVGEQISLIVEQLKQEQSERRRKKLEKSSGVNIESLVKTN
jgi:hypothetical protein